MAFVISSSVTADLVKAIITLFLGFAAFLLFLRRRLKHKSPLRLPPGPRGLPFVGFLPFLNSNLHRHFTDLAGKYGHVLSLRLGSKLCVVVTSPSAAREIFKDKDAVFANHDVPAAVSMSLGNINDIFWAPNGPLWRMLRKITVSEVLKTSSIEAVEPLRLREVRRTVGTLWERAKKGLPVEIRETMFVTALNMMTSMLWGEPVATEGESAEFRKAIEGVLNLTLTPNVADYFPALAPLDPQGKGREMRRLRMSFHAYVESVVKKRMSANAAGEKKGDHLEVALELIRKNDMQLPFTFDDLVALLANLIGGATDSTSTAVEWAMTELLNNPEKMRKAQQEIDAAVGKLRVVEESDLPDLRYICAIVKETLRLHPPVPLLIPHRPSSDSDVGGFAVPAGTMVFINVWAIQRDPTVWEDPLEFKPERFMEGQTTNCDYIAGNEFGFLTFGAGRRVCAGINLAEKMVMLVLASLLHSFDWQLPEGSPLMTLEDNFGFVLRKAVPLVALPAVRLENPELYA